MSTNDEQMFACMHIHLHSVEESLEEGGGLIDDSMSQSLGIAVANHVNRLFGRLEGGDVPEAEPVQMLQYAPTYSFVTLIVECVGVRVDECFYKAMLITINTRNISLFGDISFIPNSKFHARKSI